MVCPTTMDTPLFHQGVKNLEPPIHGPRILQGSPYGSFVLCGSYVTSRARVDSEWKRPRCKRLPFPDASGPLNSFEPPNAALTGLHSYAICQTMHYPINALELFVKVLRL